MRVLDYAAEGAAVVKAAVVTAVQGARAPARPAMSRDARAELQRRDEVNARADAMRGEREAVLFGRSRWLGKRTSGWMKRGR